MLERSIRRVILRQSHCELLRKSTARHLLDCAVCGDLARTCGSLLYSDAGEALIDLDHKKHRGSLNTYRGSSSQLGFLSCMSSFLVYVEAARLRRSKYSSSVFFPQGALPKQSLSSTCFESRMNFSFFFFGKVRSLGEMDRLLMWAE